MATTKSKDRRPAGRPIGFPSDDVFDDAMCKHMSNEFIKSDICEQCYVEEDTEDPDKFDRDIFHFGRHCPIPLADGITECKAFMA